MQKYFYLSLICKVSWFCSQFNRASLLHSSFTTHKVLLKRQGRWQNDIHFVVYWLHFQQQGWGNSPQNIRKDDRGAQYLLLTCWVSFSKEALLIPCWQKSAWKTLQSPLVWVTIWKMRLMLRLQDVLAGRWVDNILIKATGYLQYE